MVVVVVVVGWWWWWRSGGGGGGGGGGGVSVQGGVHLSLAISGRVHVCGGGWGQCLFVDLLIWNVCLWGRCVYVRVRAHAHAHVFVVCWLLVWMC